MGCSRGRALVALAIAAVAVSAIGCGGPYSSPEATYGSFKSAATGGDWQQLCTCLTPAAQESLAGNLVYLGTTAKLLAAIAPLGGDAVAAKIGAEQFQVMKTFGESSGGILTKYGVGDDAFSNAGIDIMKRSIPTAAQFRALGVGVDDKEMFVGEMMAALSAADPDVQDTFSQFGDTELTSVQVNGESATAETNIGNYRTMNFQRIDGEWKADFVMSELLLGTNSE